MIGSEIKPTVHATVACDVRTFTNACEMVQATMPISIAVAALLMISQCSERKIMIFRSFIQMPMGLARF